MKPNITIYTNLINYLFFNQIFSRYAVNFRPLKDYFVKKLKDEKNIIIYSEDQNKPLNLDEISSDTLIFLNNVNRKKINNKNIKLINRALSPQNIIKEIEEKIFNKNIIFKNILIFDNEIKNTINNKSCYLTDIEKNILEYIFIKNSTSRKHIKENILNIKSSVETNSLDSHLTRIRKKFIQIDADLIIETKNDKINIY